MSMTKRQYNGRQFLVPWGCNEGRNHARPESILGDSAGAGRGDAESARQRRQIRSKRTEQFNVGNPGDRGRRHRRVATERATDAARVFGEACRGSDDDGGKPDTSEL